MRLWVTGVGVVSPLGMDAASSFSALLEGRRAIAPLTLFELEGCRSRLAAEVTDLRVAEVSASGVSAATAAAVAGTISNAWSRTDAMAVIAAREALSHAAIDTASLPTDLILGGTTAGMFETETLVADMHASPEARQPLEQMLTHPLSSTVDRLRRSVAPFRSARTICSACSSGSNALILAAAWLRTGRSQRVLAGGADGLCRLTYAGFHALGALSPDPCRPFDIRRSGLNLGEGAAFLLVETEEAARARGAEPIAELRGWAVGAEAHHITNPEASGETACRVMRRALERAQLGADKLDYVNAHGTATRLNDKMEARALRLLLGEERKRVPVSSSKGQIGHTLGAAGAIEAVFCAMAIAQQQIPPTVGLEQIDPDCDLHHLKEKRVVPVRAAMSNSFGFGGSDAVIVLSRPDAFDDVANHKCRRVFVSAAATVGPLGVGVSPSAYIEEGVSPAAGPIAFDAKRHLDLGRARRIDRAGRLSTVAMHQALNAAGVSEAFADQAGAVLGAAFGAVDDCAAFVHRTYEKGARFASPAIFPNLLPSSPVAHASIYHSLRGPVFSTADLGATSESAMLCAVDLIAAGEIDAVLAGGVEPYSPIAEAVFGPLCLWGAEGTAIARSEGAAVLLFEGEASVLERGAEAWAEVIWSSSWRGPPRLDGLVAPDRFKRVAVFVGRAPDAATPVIEAAGWANVKRYTASIRTGDHEASGGFSAAAAVSLLKTQQLDAALCLGLAPDRGYALLFRACQKMP